MYLGYAIYFISLLEWSFFSVVVDVVCHKIFVLCVDKTFQPSTGANPHDG